MTGTDGIPRSRLETGHDRILATLFGPVRVARCAWRHPGAPNYCPADAALSLPAGRHSHSLAKLAAIEAARGSFDAAHAAIARRCGPVIAKRQAEESVVHAAADIPAFYAARVPEPCTPGTLLVMSADCKGIVMRPGALRAATAKAAAKLGQMRTRLSAGEKPNRKRMAMLTAVYDAVPAKRRPHDVITPPGGGTAPASPAPGRRPGASGWPGRSAKPPPRSSPPCSTRPDPATPLTCGPGSSWSTGPSPAQPHPGRGRPPRRHNSRHYRHNSRPGIFVGRLVEPPRGRRSRRRGLGRGQRSRSPGRRQRPGRRRVTAEADAAGLKGSQRNGADACVRYLGSKREYLRYDQAMEAGWPIATGIIEGACRHIIADRLAVSGSRWGLDGAEAVLTLRAVISNGDFEEYWRFHLKCEHQRLYPGTGQGKYALGA